MGSLKKNQNAPRPSEHPLLRLSTKGKYFVSLGCGIYLIKTETWVWDFKGK